jgi:FMN phosphatase YigB (HAD superfamily)
MGRTADATVFPPAHAAFLANLHGRYRLGVVSNFDDAATAHEILRRHGITPYLDAVVVSEALGLRKPHPAVPRAGLQGLGLAARDVLFVGDTFAEDVAGAHAAGLDAAWIDRRGEGPPAAGPPARWVVRALPELAAIL